MLTEFGNWIEQGLTWVVEHLDEPLWNITDCYFIRCRSIFLPLLQG